MDQNHQPTITDVAVHAGVSVSTVSRVLNNESSVRPQIRKKVEDAIVELGYSRIRSVGTRKRQPEMVAFLANSIDNPFFLPLLQGIEYTARLHDLRTLVVSNDYSQDVEERNVRDILEAGVKGIIHLESTQAPFLRKLLDDGFPLVLLERHVDDTNASYVNSSDEMGAHQATTYLIKLGHREIAFLRGPIGIATAEERFSGYKQALRENQIEVDDELICGGEYEYEVARAAIAELIDQGKRFSALFAANDMMAFGAIAALRERGISIPEDVSVVGYDDIPLASSISLTTVAQPIYDMGRNAVLLLLDLLSSRVKHPTSIVLRSHLVIRKSCKINSSAVHLSE